MGMTGGGKGVSNRRLWKYLQGACAFSVLVLRAILGQDST